LNSFVKNLIASTGGKFFPDRGWALEKGGELGNPSDGEFLVRSRGGGGEVGLKPEREACPEPLISHVGGGAGGKKKPIRTQINPGEIKVNSEEICSRR